MGVSSDEYYEMINDQNDEQDEDHIEEIHQTSAEEIVETYMQQWSALYDVEETSEEYMKEYISISEQVQNYINDIAVPEGLEYDIVGFSAFMNNEIGNCPFEESEKLNKLYTLHHLKNKDDLCLIHAVKYQIQNSQMSNSIKQAKITRLNEIIEKINENKELFEFANETQYLTQISSIIKMEIRVYSDFQCEKIKEDYNNFDNLNVTREGQYHYFNSEEEESNNILFQDYFNTSTTFTSSDKFTNTIHLYKVSEFSSRFGTRFHYEPITEFHKSHSIELQGTTVKVFSVHKTKTENKYRLEQQLQLQINQLDEIKETKKRHEQDTQRYNTIKIAEILNMQEYCEDLKTKVRTYGETTTSKLFVASFDFETIIKEGKAEIYSFSFVLIERNKDRSDLTNYLTFFEINHEPNNIKKQEDLEKKILLIMQAIEAYLKPEAVLTYTFNGKKFDHVLLLEIIHKFKMTDYLNETTIGENGEKFDEKSSVKIVNGGIQKMCFLNKFHILDIKLILGLGTLKDQCKNFQVTTPKLTFNHYQVQEHYDLNQDLLFEPLLGKDIEDYNNIDCISVLQIHEKLEKELLSAIDETKKCNYINEKNHKILTDKIQEGSFFTCGEISLAVEEASQKHNMKDEDGQKYTQEKFEFEQKQNKYSYEDYKWIRKSCVGGRTEAFEPGVHNTNLTGEDFVSLYPSVELDENNFYPCGKIIQYEQEEAWKEYKIEVLNEGKLAIAEITLQEQTSTHCLFAIREDSGKLNWTEKKPNKNITVTSVELNKAITLGYKFKMQKCMIWESKINGKELFRTLEMFFNKKEQQDLNKANDEKNGTKTTNHAMREIMKIICNSLYGKMMQKIHETTQVYVDQKQNEIHEQKIKSIKSLGHGMLQQEIFMNEKEIKKEMKEVWIASYVYAYARLKLFNCYLDEDLAKQGFEPLYCDTDSCFYDYKHYEIVKENANKKYENIWHDKLSVAQLGQLTQELCYDGNDFVKSKAVIIAPKFYVFLKEGYENMKSNNYYKKGAKGMDYKSDIIITPEIKQELDETLRESTNVQESLRVFMMKLRKEYILEGEWRSDEDKYFKEFETKQINYLIKMQEKGHKSVNIITQRLLTTLVEKDMMEKKLDACSINNVVMIKNIKFDV